MRINGKPVTPAANRQRGFSPVNKEATNDPFSSGGNRDPEHADVRTNGSVRSNATAIRSASNGRNRNLLAQQRIIREKAVEKAQNRLTRLNCGPSDRPHYADRETDVKYSSWRPKGKTHWCELCGEWRKTPSYERRVLPDDPMF